MNQGQVQAVLTFWFAQGWDECEPVYLEFPGWTESTAGVTEWDKLPAAARAYLRALEELSGCPLAIVSTSLSIVRLSSLMRMRNRCPLR